MDSSVIVFLALAMPGLRLVYTAQAQLADTPWPMFRHDLQHTGRIHAEPNEIQAPLKLS